MTIKSILDNIIDQALDAYEEGFIAKCILIHPVRYRELSHELQKRSTRNSVQHCAPQYQVVSLTLPMGQVELKPDKTIPRDGDGFYIEGHKKHILHKMHQQANKILLGDIEDEL